MKSVLVYLVLIGLCVLAFLRWGPAYSQSPEYSQRGDAIGAFRTDQVREAMEAHRNHPDPETRMKCEGRICRPVVELEMTVTITYDTVYGLWTVHYPHQ